MEEKILNTRKNGMAMLLLTLLGYVAVSYTHLTLPTTERV